MFVINGELVVVVIDGVCRVLDLSSLNRSLRAGSRSTERPTPAPAPAPARPAPAATDELSYVIYVITLGVNAGTEARPQASLLVFLFKTFLNRKTLP